MSEEVSNTAGASPPPVTLLQMMTGYWVSQALYVAAKLGIADLLADGPVTLSRTWPPATRTDAPSLFACSVLSPASASSPRRRPATFALTPLADTAARARHPTPCARWPSCTPRSSTAPGATCSTACRTGTAGLRAPVRHGTSSSTSPNTPRPTAVFNEAMTGWTTQLAGAVVRRVRLLPVRHRRGRGGESRGRCWRPSCGATRRLGACCSTCRTWWPAPEPVLVAAGVADRCQRVGGDFFQAVPAGGDAYLLAQILHDWDDERCVAILTQCRRAMPAHGKLLVVELVLPPGEEPFFGKWLDLHMLVMVGATRADGREYETLLSAGGFELSRVVPTQAGPSIVEAVPA